MSIFVITGSTKGIGFALARNVVARGGHVLISGRDQADVDAAVARLASTGSGEAIGLAADVTDPPQLQALWEKAVAVFGRVDVWINNAGVANTTKKITETSPADLRNMVTTNMLGTVQGSQVAARGMMAQGGGKIFNILGGGSDGEYFPGMGIYGSTKRGLDYFTRALARELAGTPVIVGRVRPGVIVTEGVIREIKADLAGFTKSRRMMNVICDLPDTVAPYLVERMLEMNRSGGKIAWLSGGKIAKRFLMARFKPRADLFQSVGL